MSHLILTAHEARGVTALMRPVVWRPREAGLNLAFSGLEFGPYCTGAPQHGYVLRSRDGSGCWNDRTWPEKPPFAPGDLVPCKEDFSAWFSGRHWRNTPPRLCTKDRCSNLFYRDGHRYPDDDQKWVKARLMPAWAVRRHFRVSAVRPVRLGEVTEADAQAMGFERPILQEGPVLGRIFGREQRGHPMTGYYIDAFKAHYEATHGIGSFERDKATWWWLVTGKMEAT